MGLDGRRTRPILGTVVVRCGLPVGTNPAKTTGILVWISGFCRLFRELEDALGLQ
jgi:hypothetical protein